MVSWVDCYVFFEEFGVGLGGGGGFTPHLEGFPESCAPANLLLQLTDGLGGTTGLLWLGISETDIPFFGGRLYIDLSFQWAAITIMLSGPPGGDGLGVWSSPGIDFFEFQGLTFVLQATLLDAAAPFGVSLSNALRLDVR